MYAKCCIPLETNHDYYGLNEFHQVNSKRIDSRCDDYYSSIFETNKPIDENNSEMSSEFYRKIKPLLNEFIERGANIYKKQSGVLCNMLISINPRNDVNKFIVNCLKNNLGPIKARYKNNTVVAAFLNKIKIISYFGENNENIMSNFANIIVGGYKVGRGKTIHDLLTTVMFIDGINRTKKRDSTLLQRARWFGYREKIFNETKVCFKRTNSGKFYNFERN